MPSGWNADFPNDMIWDVAVLSHEVATVQTPLFVTRGGNNFVRNKENRAVDFDGRRVPVAKLDRDVSKTAPAFTGTALQIDEDTMALFEPGSTTVTVAGPPAVHTITPISKGIPLVVGDYLKRPRLRWMRSGGGFVDVYFPLGLVTQWAINAQDANEGEIPFTIESRIDMDAVGASTDDAGYEIVITDPTP